MLVLTRKVGEWFRVGEAIVKISQVGQRRVQVAIEAPANVPVVRGEIDGTPPKPPRSPRRPRH